MEPGGALRASNRRRGKTSYELCAARPDRCARLPALPRHDDLRLEEVARVGAGGGRGAAVRAAAVEAGINFFDTADMYSRGESEEITGKLLREFQPRREELVIATKVFNPMSDRPNERGLSRKHIMALHRPQPEAPRRRLRRPLPDPSLRQEHAHRGDLRGARRCRAGRQGALHRRLQHVRLAVPEDAGLPAATTRWRGSSPCRTTTTSSIARRSGR